MRRIGDCLIHPFRVLLRGRAIVTARFVPDRRGTPENVEDCICSGLGCSEVVQASKFEQLIKVVVLTPHGKLLLGPVVGPFERSNDACLQSAFNRITCQIVGCRPFVLIEQRPRIVDPHFGKFLKVETVHRIGLVVSENHRSDQPSSAILPNCTRIAWVEGRRLRSKRS